MKAEGTGHGKLILFGEHAAVHGHPAIGLPLDCSVTVTWSEGIGGTSNSDTAVIPQQAEGGILDDDAAAFGDLLAVLAARRPALRHSGGTWSILGNVPRTGGFGSSAALCVALARLVLARPDRGYDREVHILAHELERRFHGSPSGIDTGMAGDEGPAAWRKSNDGVPDRVPLTIPELPLLFGALPRSAPTAKTVAGLATRLHSGDRTVSHAMSGLGNISEEFIDLCGGDSGTSGGREPRARPSDFALQVGNLAERAQSLLAALGLSTTDLEELLRLAKDLGAVGGKLSGGGKGGAFFLCPPDRSVRERLADRLPPLLAARNIVLAHPLTPLDAGTPR